MELDHEFTVPVPQHQAWAVLMDVERIAPCMPGATFDGFEDDGGFKGRVKVKLGPITVTYQGTARFAERDEESGLAVIEARGKESRGSGTANATIRAQLREDDGSTVVRVVTDLNVTGRPAQFGRGVMAEVGGKLVGQFADCLAAQISAGAPAVAPAAEDQTAAVAPAEAAAAAPPMEAPRPTADAIDLLDTAGAPVLKRVVPVVAALVVGFVVWRLARRHR